MTTYEITAEMRYIGITTIEADSPGEAWRKAVKRDWWDDGGDTYPMSISVEEVTE